MRNSGIIAYGTPEDRKKLAALANLEHFSGSEWLIHSIRNRYTEVFGDLDPEVASKK